MTALTMADAVARSATLRELRIGRGVVAETGAVLRRHFEGDNVCLIADDNTWAAAGPKTEASIAAAGLTVRRHVLPGRPRPKPTTELSRSLSDMLSADAAIPVAIGSGVLNDVVKHAAFLLGRPYLCVATAASMDGYTSAGAPLSEKGFKKTIQCRPARAVLGDMDIVTAAPRAMVGWGYGDLAGKVPAGADWMLADALGIEPIDDVAWPMVQVPLRGWLADPGGIAAGNPAATEGLFTGLSLVGLAMELHGSSRPASGADHQIAHLWEMEGLEQNGERVSHGACVAVGTTVVLGLYDWLLRQDLSRLDPLRAGPGLAAKTREIAVWLGGGEIAARAAEETAAKHPDPETLRIRLTRLAAVWPELRPRLQARLMSAAEMRQALRAAGAPADARDIGVDRTALRRAVLAARFLRSRYTVLDLLDEAGLLETAVEAVLPPVRIDAG